MGAKMQSKIDTKGYKLVVTGHSLGAGAAALISLKLRDNFEGWCPHSVPVHRHARAMAMCLKPYSVGTNRILVSRRPAAT